MILVDTSVWIEHLRGSGRLDKALDQEIVLLHPFVLGEIAMGSWKERNSTLSELAELPPCQVAANAEVLDLVESRGLHGSGIGYIDAHLLAAVLLTPGATLWTFDQRLKAAAERCGVAAQAN